MPDAPPTPPPDAAAPARAPNTTPAPAPNPAPDPNLDVHLAHTAKPAPQTPWLVEPPLLPIGTLALWLGLAGVFIVLHTVNTLFGAAAPVVTVCVVVISVAYATWHVFFRDGGSAARRARTRAARERSTYTTDPAFRLRVVGKPEALTLALDLPPPGRAPGDFGEPRVFRVGTSGPSGRSRSRWLLQLGVAALAIGVFLLNENTLRFKPGFIIIWGVLALGAAALWGAWPVYVRVVPGRLDVMEFSFLGRNHRRTTRLDLRRGSVLIDLRANLLRCEAPAPQGAPDAGAGASAASRAPKATHIPLAGALRRAPIVRAVLEAARSDEPAPLLPDDALTG